MPLEPENEIHLERAQGYCELGMFLEANIELEEIDDEVRHLPEILEVRVEIYRNLKKWALMQAVAKKLVDFVGEPQWWVCWAYATRQEESLEKAVAILAEAASHHPDDATVLYNLACYEACSGQIASGKTHLQRALQIDPELRLDALDEEDLKPLW